MAQRQYVQSLSNVPANQTLYLVENALPGDYNQNLVVDAADYTVWRNQLGMTGAGLAADGNGDNQVSQLDYNVWKANFGVTAVIEGAGALSAAVPESSTGVFIALVIAIAACSDWTRTRRQDPP